MKNLKRKLRSNRGASITFALLIFLVCAIVSGVVIVAASTAGGRMSGMKETDQRYFAATAAAHVLQDIFDGETIEVTYDVSNPANASTPAGTNAIAAAASKAVIAKSGTVDIAIPAIPGPAGEGETSPFTCKIEPSMKNGLLYFDISAENSNPRNPGKTDAYGLTIVFSSNVKKPDAGSSSSAKATVTWSLNSLSRGQASQKTGG